MRIAFFGATALGFECCKLLVEEGHQVVGIFTVPSTFSIKYRDEPERRQVQNVLFRDFGYFEEKYQIPVCKMETKVGDYFDVLEAWKPDFILVVGWYHMIPKKMMDLPAKGVAGIHASLLPKYRGNAPLVWAILNGEKEAGVSLFCIDGAGVDEGDILQQERFDIEESDTIKEVLAKAESASLHMLKTSIPLIANGTVPRTKQDHSAATCFPKRTPDDGLVDWSWDNARIKNFVRAQTKPYPGAFTMIEGRKIQLWDIDLA